VTGLRRAAVVLAVTAAFFASSAGASSLPSLLANIKCAHPCTHLNGIYKVRPTKVVLSEAAGGNLSLSWTSWTGTSAVGSGTSGVSGMGTTTTTNIEVTASNPKKGHFTRLTITFKESDGTNQVEHLHLETSGGSPGWTT
jgi:hypothetical protein